MIVVDGIETELTPGLLGLAPTHTKYRTQTQTQAIEILRAVTTMPYRVNCQNVMW